MSYFSSQGDDTDKDPEAETESGPPAEKNSAKTSNSLESLYSGQSSSSKCLLTPHAGCTKECWAVPQKKSLEVSGSI